MANVGTPDRVARAALGLFLIVVPFLPFAASFFAAWGAWKLAVAIVGFVLVATSAMRFCPLYSVLGINTSRVEDR